MNIYFDCEFTGLHKDTTLISIGLIDENGRSFYAEFSDYDKSQCNDWINENVIAHLLYDPDYKTWNGGFIPGTVIYGTKHEVGKALREWFSYYKKPINQLISDVCHYDMVLLIDLFGTAFDLPENISPVCYDINTDIAKFYNITDYEAFDMSRETILKHFRVNIPGEKHNSLYDAKVIKEIYENIRKYRMLDRG